MESVPDRDLPKAQLDMRRAEIRAARDALNVSALDMAPLGASLQLAILRRITRVIAAYCESPVQIPSDALDWVYIALRNSMFASPDLTEIIGAEHYAALDEALPTSLAHIDALAALGIWEDYLRPAIDGFRGNFLAACNGLCVWPFDPVADHTIGVVLGYDDRIAEYEEVKEAATRACLAAIDQGSGLDAAMSAGQRAMTAMADEIWRRNHPDESPEGEKAAGGRPKGTYDWSRESLLAAVREYIAGNDRPILEDFQRRNGIPASSWQRYAKAYGFTWSGVLDEYRQKPSRD